MFSAEKPYFFFTERHTLEFQIKGEGRINREAGKF